LKILLIRPGALGDTLMLLPSLAYLKRRVRITLAGRHPGLHFVRGHVHAAMDFEGAGWHNLFMGGQDRGALPVSSIDLVVAFFSRQKEKIRQNLEVLIPGSPIHVFSPLPPEGQEVHAARHIAECLGSTGLPVDPEKSMIQAVTKGLLEGPAASPQKRLLFHPGSGDPKKNHSPDFWLSLVERMRREPGLKGLKPGFLLGPAENRVYPFFKDKVKIMGGQVYFCPEKDLLTSLLKGALLYLGQDSGITHLSAMLGTPTVALFKNSDPTLWRPLGPKVRVIKHDANVPELIDKVLEALNSFVGMPT